jgi:hypothetical protein
MTFSCVDDSITIEIGFLKSNTFTLLIDNPNKDLIQPKELVWTTKQVDLPSISTEQPILTANVYDNFTHGSDYNIDDCTVTFNVSKNLKNYIWLKSLLHQYTTGLDSRPFKSALYLMTSDNQITKTGFILNRCFPVSLSGLSFNVESDEPITASFSFKPSSWNIIIDGIELQY